MDKVVIRFTARQEDQALPILLRRFSGTILPGRTYVVSTEVVAALRKAGVGFTEISSEANAPTLEGAGWFTAIRSSFTAS